MDRQTRQERIADRVLAVVQREGQRNEALDVVVALIATAAVLAPDCMDEGTFVAMAVKAFRSAVAAEAN